MIPVRRVLVDKRRSLVPLAVVFAINLVVYLVGVYPLTLRVRRSEARLAAAEQQLANARRVERNVRAVTTGQLQTSEELRRFYAEVLPGNVAGARRITFLRLAELAQQAGLEYEQRRTEQHRERESNLEQLRVTMTLEGGYHNIRRFLHRLETADEFVVIDHMGLSEGIEPNAPLALTVTLSTYYRVADGP
jgi:hypothetical protein